MIKVHVDNEKDIEEIEAQGNTMEILGEVAFITGEILLETYENAKKDGLNATLEEYIEPFINALRDAVLELGEEEEENEIIVTKVNLDKDQATEFEKILESKNNEEVLNFLKKLF